MRDLIIVGGGPSGASAAHSAASKGLNVLLIEKETFPRYKPCGGAVSELGLSYIAPIPKSLIENEIHGARIKYKGRAIEVVKQERLAVLVARDTFDNFLLERAQAAGAEVRVDKITDFIEEDDCVRVVSKQGKEYTTRFLIIAEGAHGKLKNKISTSHAKDQQGVSMVTKVAAPNQKETCLSVQLIEFHFGVTQMGYGWIFPHKNHYSVGIFGIASQMKNARKRLTGFLEYNNLPQNSPLKGHIIPFGYKKKLAAQRTLLCGDAGGFVDTISGEGIAYAIRSGQIAAEKIAEIGQENTTPNLASYEKACREEFDENLKYSYILAQYINRFPDLFYSIMVNDKCIRKFLDIPIMKTTYKKFIFSLLPELLLHFPMLLLKNSHARYQETVNKSN